VTAPARASATREAILTAAERLYAEHGVLAVSNRQISEAAGQGNNTAVGYHFGTRADLVRAIARRHSAAVEELRARMLAELGPGADLRDWVRCLVHPSTEHLARAGTPPDRLPPAVEAAAYFVIAEALTNVAKYANATNATVAVRRAGGHACVEVRDDGVGGADPGRGSGLQGLADRVGALDGSLALDSPPGSGTTLRAEIPV